jgi:hypothetical protein
LKMGELGNGNVFRGLHSIEDGMAPTLFVVNWRIVRCPLNLGNYQLVRWFNGLM